MCDHPNRERAMAVITPGKIWCDPCLEPLVRALNDAGISTTASCCGHGQHHGWVMLADGRVLRILDSLEESHRVDRLEAEIERMNRAYDHLGEAVRGERELEDCNTGLQRLAAENAGKTS